MATPDKQPRRRLPIDPAIFTPSPRPEATPEGWLPMGADEYIDPALWDEANVEYLQQQVVAGKMTINTARARLGLPPFEPSPEPEVEAAGWDDQAVRGAEHDLAVLLSKADGALEGVTVALGIGPARTIRAAIVAAMQYPWPHTCPEGSASGCRLCLEVQHWLSPAREWSVGGCALPGPVAP